MVILPKGFAAFPNGVATWPRFYDGRPGSLDVGECFNIQCFDPATRRSYFFKLAKKMNIRIATQMFGPPPPSA
jgi:hypothetical protein